MDPSTVQLLGAILAVSGDEPTAAGTALRAGVIYAVALVIVRLGSKRFLSKATAFDVLIAIMLGSIMSRGIDGRTPVVVTVVGGGVLVGLHWLFGVLAYHTEWFGSVIKGHRVVLIKDGEIQKDGMRRSSITEADLQQAVRMQTKQNGIANVKLAYLERNGEISIVPYKKEPQIVHVDVKDGVQTVRVELQ